MFVIDKVFTIDLYRFLHGVITRNASSLLPVSDWHKYIDGLPEKEQHEIVEYVFWWQCLLLRWCVHIVTFSSVYPSKNSMLDAKLTIGNYMQSTLMLDLCIEGTGLFPIANSMNHSCEPNTTLACATNSSQYAQNAVSFGLLPLHCVYADVAVLGLQLSRFVDLREVKSCSFHTLTKTPR
jgi:hypothetical protein